MPPKKRLESTVYIIDCSNVNQHIETFIEIFSLKYFGQTKGIHKDIQSIILYNAPGLKSILILNDWMTYELDIVSSMKETLHSTDDSVHKPTNFLNVLNTAFTQLDKDEITPNYIKRVVFLTDLSSDIPFDNKTDDKIDFLKQEIHNENIWLYVIGLNIKLPKLLNQNEIHKLDKIIPIGELTPHQKLNYEMMRRFDRNVVFLDKTHGVDILFAHKVQPKAPFPWYVNMNIGTDIQIPIMAHRTTRSPEIIKFHPCPANADQAVSGVKLWYDVNTHERVEMADIVKGYKFQQKFVQLTDEQLKHAKKIETRKCLSIVGFADKEDVPYNLLIMSDTLSCIKADPRQPDSAADRRFQLFVTSLRIKQVVALAYRVYNNGNGRKLYCIFPCPEHKNDRHLLMGQIPYEHEVQEGFFKGKVEEDYTSDTFDLMKNFLDKLTPYDDETNQELYPLPPSMQVSHSRAHMASFLLHRYIGDSIPEAPELKMHPVIEKRASDDVDALLKATMVTDS